jgi:hypothetical protein
MRRLLTVSMVLAVTALISAGSGSYGTGSVANRSRIRGSVF